MKVPFAPISATLLLSLTLGGCAKNPPAPMAPLAAPQAADGRVIDPKTEVAYNPQITTALNLLTGGSSRTWVLDNMAAATITVGPSDAAPTGYYAGGAAGSLPACQADDEYTFSTNATLSYNALAETFVAGVSTCQAPRSYTSAFGFGPAVGLGFAQIELRQPNAFIGVTDAPGLVYRILSIDNQHMLLRAGRPNGPLVFTFKFRVK